MGPGTMAGGNGMAMGMAGGAAASAQQQQQMLQMMLQRQMMQRQMMLAGGGTHSQKHCMWLHIVTLHGKCTTQALTFEHLFQA